MILELPFDIDQKIYVIANKKKMNAVGRVITEKTRLFTRRLLLDICWKEKMANCVLWRDSWLKQT